MSAPDTVSDPELQEVAWDLTDLLNGAGEDPQAGVDALLADAQARADTFAETYAGKLSSIDGAGLIAAMQELAEIEEIAARAGTYAHLAFSTDTQSPANGALLQRVEEKGTAIETKLLFFHLEWAALDDAKADELLATDGLDFARHHLKTARRYRPHLLSEPEERILAEKQLSGRSAWVRLFEEQTAAITVELPDEGDVPLDAALSRLFSPDREVRRDTAERVTGALAPGLRTRAYAFNTLLADKMTDDRLRNYPHWLAARNLSNEASDESVQALIEAVRARYEVPRRWYRLKAQLLGLDKLADYDRMAAVTQDNEKIGWPQAKEIVQDAYSSFSDELGGIVSQFFAQPWIDGPVRPGKRGGAFCSYGVPSAHPYVLLNYTHLRRDVLTLAHELGHGVHAVLGGSQGVFHMATPLTLAETASVFGETLVFGRLLEASPSAESRLSLLAESIEGSIATVFRQVAMNRFEHLIHTHRRETGELSVDDFGALWAQSQEELLGDAVEVTENYRSWWSYVPHFVASPGYVYAYAYGQLLALAVYGRYEEEGAGFEADYVNLLRAGGSKSPEDLGQIVGVDLADPGFWDKGLDLVERKLEQAEQAAKDAGRI
ncbi:M3 family oligoendopeptidase [Solirubrobacter sp. CPCC 204708]|uniref:M3 family oligoendopeptidase n=1 Tax=Solirubrobacter deserti TaxID=2282478 RepID=A0ABT4RIY7_9ACTN|nr:M3 family oligoendopeptidase [Solirubrobacter deserti]MBE2320869.1 M3 family oligoendopeptidase [Solirubrobacter deserti]MDA0138504.1 M3 family oligoendopeptidase [Solirubrobacter deserti]